MTRDIALTALAALGVFSDRATNRSTPAAPTAPRPVTVRDRGPAVRTLTAKPVTATRPIRGFAGSIDVSVSAGRR
jgi:hypothetical protein